MVRPVAFPCCVYAVVTPQEKEGVETKPWSEASGAMLGGWNGRRRTSDGFCSWLCFQAGCPILQQLGTREGSGVQSGQNQSLGARSSLNLRARPDSLCVCVCGGDGLRPASPAFMARTLSADLEVAERTHTRREGSGSGPPASCRSRNGSSLLQLSNHELPHIYLPMDIFPLVPIVVPSL